MGRNGERHGSEGKTQNLVKYYEARIDALIYLKEYKAVGKAYCKLFELDGEQGKHWYNAAVIMLEYEYEDCNRNSNAQIAKIKRYIELAIEKDPNNGIYYAHYAKVCRMMNEDEIYINAYVQKALTLSGQKAVAQIVGKCIIDLP